MTFACFLRCNMNSKFFDRKYREFVLLLATQDPSPQLNPIQTLIGFINTQEFKVFLIGMLEEWSSAADISDNVCSEEDVDAVDMLNLMSSLCALINDADIITAAGPLLSRLNSISRIAACARMAGA